jgi:acetyl esterase
MQGNANLQLRGVSGPLRAHVSWPAVTDPGASPALLVLLPDAEDVQAAAALSRELCARAGVVVLLACVRLAPDRADPATLTDATTALEWAADHAAELYADPERLLVAGVGTGAAIAAALAIHARDQHWPQVERQVLICPDFAAYAGPLRAASLADVAPATVVTRGSGARRDVGTRYAALLREAGVDVEELHHDDDQRLLGDLAASLLRV